MTYPIQPFNSPYPNPPSSGQFGYFPYGASRQMPQQAAQQAYPGYPYGQPYAQHYSQSQQPNYPGRSPYVTRPPVQPANQSMAHTLPIGQPRQPLPNMDMPNPALPGQPGMPQIPGMPPGFNPAMLANMNPEQLNAFKKQLKQNMMDQAKAMLKSNPEMRKQMLQMIDMAKAGKLPDAMVEQMINPFGGYGDELENLTPKQIAKIGVISTASGFGLGAIFNHLMHSLSEKKGNSLMDHLVKGIERIPGIGSWSREIENYMNRIPADSQSGASALLRMDGALSAKQTEANLFNRLFGEGGMYHQDIQQWVSEGLPKNSAFKKDFIIQELQKARTFNRMEQIINTQAQSFIPIHMREIVENEIGSRMNNSLLHKARNMVGGAGKAGSVTLSHIDQMLAQNNFINYIETASLNGKIPKTVYDTITNTLGTYYGDPMHGNLKKLLTESRFKPAGSAIRSLLGVEAGATAEQVMAKVAAETGYRPFWEQLAVQSKGLLRLPMRFKPESSWLSVVSHFNKHGLNQELAKTASGQSMLQQFKNMFRHFESFQSFNKPIIQERHAIHKLLKSRGVGPIGRFFANIPYFMQRLFMGNRYRHITAKPIMGFIPNKLGGLLWRLFISTMLISFPLGSMWKADDDLKVPKFIKSLTTNLAGWLGYDVGFSFASELNLLNKSKFLSKIIFKRMLPFLPFTWGGLLKSVVIPFAFASAFGGIANFVVSKFVGNPEKVERNRKLDKLKHDLGLDDGKPKSKHSLNPFKRTNKPEAVKGPGKAVSQNINPNNPFKDKSGLPIEVDQILSQPANYHAYNDGTSKYTGHIMSDKELRDWAWSD